MVNLVAQSAFEGHLPADFGGLNVAEVTYDKIQSIAIYPGQEAAVRARLKEAFGAELPLPNRFIGPVQWVAPQQYLLLDEWLIGLEAHAAVTDQSDGWAILSVEGHQVEAVLARLIPIDLRFTVFAEGQTARTLIGHMQASVSRRASDRIELMVMRSMAGTLVHELSRAAKVYESRAEI